MKGNKYHAKRVTVDGVPFDSQREANRYRELKVMERAGEIANLRRQEEFLLIPKQEVNGRCAERAVKYRADFVYTKNGHTVVEDAKGYRTEVYRLKRKLMLWIHGIRITEV